MRAHAIINSLTTLLFAATAALALEIPATHVNKRRDLLLKTPLSLGSFFLGNPAVALADDKSDESPIVTNALEEAIRSELDSRHVRWSLDPTSYTDTANPAFHLRYGTSTLDSSSKSPNPRDPPLCLPEWFAGTWLITYKFQKASFPQGREALTLRLAGAGLGTCLSVPNVGTNPIPYPVRFQKLKMDENQTVVAYQDWAYNLPRHFEAFWPKAKVTSVQTGDAFLRKNDGLSPPCFVSGEGCKRTENPHLHSPATRIVLEYQGPTRSNPSMSQRIDATAVGTSIPSCRNDEDVVFSRQFIQRNEPQSLETYFKEVSAWRRTAEEAVEGRTRVAAFLPHREADLALSNQYQQGLALATYSYNVKMRRISEDEAAAL